MTLLEQARAEAAEHRTKFLRLHMECCEAFGAYCEAMNKVQELTSSLHHTGLGGDVEAENLLARLLIRESPVKTAMRTGLEVTKSWGWDKSSEVVPLVPIRRVSEVA